MFKKVLPVLLCLTICLLAGCSKNNDRLSVDKGDEPSISETESAPVLSKNPLTGISELTADKADDRPVAIMVNNISLAQPVQTGLNKADIVF